MKNAFFLIIIIIAASVHGIAQNNVELRHIKTTALEIFESYESIMARLHNGNVYNEDQFLDLFCEDATLYNDIIIINNPKYISPSEYYKLFVENIQQVYSKYTNLQLRSAQSVDEKWLIQCSFTREIRYLTTTSKKYPIWSFDYTIMIEMDKKYDAGNFIYENAKIRSIDVSNPLAEFFIVQNNPSLLLEYKNEKIDNYDLESNARLFLKKDYSITQFESPDKNIFKSLICRADQLDSNFFAFDLKKKNLQGFRVDQSIAFSGNQIVDSNLSDIDLSGNSLSLSFLRSKNLRSSEKATWFLNTGIISYWNLHRYSGINYTEYPSLDADSDPYLRKISIDALSENINTLSLSIPISIEYAHQVSSSESHPSFISFEFGACLDLPILILSDYKLDAQYTGYYSQYFGGIEFDHYYDYGRYDIVGQKSLNFINNFRYDFGLIGSFSYWIALNENNLVKLSLSYKHTFLPPADYNEELVITTDHSSYESLLQSTNQGQRNLLVGISFIKTIPR